MFAFYDDLICALRANSRSANGVFSVRLKKESEAEKWLKSHGTRHSIFLARATPADTAARSLAPIWDSTRSQSRAIHMERIGSIFAPFAANLLILMVFSKRQERHSVASLTN